MNAPETSRMREIVSGIATVSDKIRALDDAGYKRADIARFLEKRYQHVRNVLVGPKPKRKAANADIRRREEIEPDGAPAVLLSARLQIGAGGRVVIPSEMRAAINVGEGDFLYAHVDDGVLVVHPPKTSVAKARAIVRKYVPEGVSLADELIADRRAEAERENSGMRPKASGWPVNWLRTAAPGRKGKTPK